MKHEGYLLRLDADSWAEISKKSRNSIRKAEKEGVRIELSQDMDAFKKLHFKPGNLPPSVPANGELYLAYKESQAVAGMVILKEKDRLVYGYAGSSKLGRKCQANSLLIWHVVRHYQGTPYQYLDLGYSLRQSLNRFKRNFATSTYPLPDRILEEKGYFKIAIENFFAILNDDPSPAAKQYAKTESLQELLLSRQSMWARRRGEEHVRVPPQLRLNDRIFALYEDEIYLHRLLYLKGKLQPNLPARKKYAMVLTHSCSRDRANDLKSWIDLERKHKVRSTFFVEPNPTHEEQIEALSQASRDGWEIGLHAAVNSAQSKQTLENVIGGKILGARLKHLLLDSSAASVLKQSGVEYDSSFGNHFPGWRNFLAHPFMYHDLLYEIPLCLSSSYAGNQKEGFVKLVKHFIDLIRGRSGILTIDMAIGQDRGAGEKLQIWDEVLTIANQDEECVTMRGRDILQNANAVRSTDLGGTDHSADLTAPKTTSMSV
jgi:hypothetical protein